MKWMALFAAVLCGWSHAPAMTWNFDEDGDAQGWVARDNVMSGTTVHPLLEAEVRNGVWRIQPTPFETGRNPAVELISPRIGQDSELFDRLIVRLRLVHTRPIASTYMGLQWTNSLNRRTPGEDSSEWFAACADSTGSVCNSRFALWRTTTYTTAWSRRGMDHGRSI